MAIEGMIGQATVLGEPVMIIEQLGDQVRVQNEWGWEEWVSLIDVDDLVWTLDHIEAEKAEWEWQEEMQRRYFA
jgi:hypothetical protein